jgi:nicotianamine synthase
MTILGERTPTLKLSVEELCEQIVAIHDALARLPDLEPGPVVNRLFTDLVRLCEYRTGEDTGPVIDDPRITTFVPQLRQWCASGEFLLERSWARSIIGAADPDAQLAAFPYLANYQDLTCLELHALAAVGVDLSHIQRVCFLGGGPLPVSALLISRALSVPLDVVDVDADATTLGAQVAGRVSVPTQVHFHHGDAADFEAVADSDVVFLAALVGLDRHVKHRVLRALGARMRPGSMLVARSSHGLRTLLYPPLELSDLQDWRALAVLHPFNAVVNSVVVAVRR